MLVLNRESIIQGLIEIREEEETNNELIINIIKQIIRRRDIDNLEKLKLINNELNKFIISDFE